MCVTTLESGAVGGAGVVAAVRGIGATLGIGAASIINIFDMRAEFVSVGVCACGVLFLKIVVSCSNTCLCC